MAVPALVVAVVLMLAFVPVWALIWGRKANARDRARRHRYRTGAAPSS